MPQLVADREEPPAVVLPERLVVAVQVRDVGEHRPQAVVRRAAQAVAHRVFERPQRRGEREVLLVRERLVVKDEYRVAVHRGVDLLRVLWSERRGEVDAVDLGADVPAERTDVKGKDGAHGFLRRSRIWTVNDSPTAK